MRRHLRIGPVVLPRRAALLAIALLFTGALAPPHRSLAAAEAPETARIDRVEVMLPAAALITLGAGVQLASAANTGPAGPAAWRFDDDPIEWPAPDAACRAATRGHAQARSCREYSSRLALLNAGRSRHPTTAPPHFVRS